MASAWSASLQGVWGGSPVGSRGKAPGGVRGEVPEASDISLIENVFLQLKCI
jgi:hypothetical protein